MLTNEQIKLLEKPFEAHEHGFVQQNPYILKSAIMGRLSEVDPGWHTTTPVLIGVQDDVVLMEGGLTISDVTRHAIGTGIITRHIKDKNNIGEIIELSIFEQQRQVSKAMKTAQSDLIPRCAALFGIGAYLRERKRNQPLDECLPEALNVWQRKWARLEHWAYDTAQKQAFADAMKGAGLIWTVVQHHLEPERKLERLSDTSLSFTEAIARLEQLESA